MTKEAGEMDQEAVNAITKMFAAILKKRIEEVSLYAVGQEVRQKSKAQHHRASLE